MLDVKQEEKETQSSEYISFLNALNPNINIIRIVSIQEPSEDCLTDWVGIKSIVGMSDRQEIYEIDIRFAWGRKIFQQHLYDYGWNKSILLSSINRHKKSRHKLIIYLCAPSTTLVDRIQMQSIPEEFIIGSYWQSINHLYLLLPFPHPFELPELSDTDLVKHSSLTDLPSLSTIIGNEKSLVAGGLRTKGINKSGTLDRPLISVITVVFNGEKNLEQTIQSVINQNYENFEYIIIDGGSTDKTIDIIQKYEDRIDYWKSEKDMGIYDGMNKGIDLASGQWLNFMNCGDCFYNHHTLSMIPLKSDIDFYYSDIILHDKMGNTELWNCSQAKKTLVHQSIVYKKSLHSNYKYLVHDRLTISDYFFFRKNDYKNWFKLNTPLSIYNTEGISGNGSKVFVQRLFVDFMAGDISEFEMSLLIIGKIVRSPLRIIRNMFMQLSILKSARRV